MSKNKDITSNQARRNNCGKSRNYLRPTRINTNIKSMCCRLHRCQRERGTTVLYQTRQNAAIVEKVGTTYALLESIQTKISICCRLHRWHYEQGNKILYQTRQNAAIVEKVGTTYALLELQTKISICYRLHRWHYERETTILYQTRQNADVEKKLETTYELLDSMQT